MEKYNYEINDYKNILQSFIQKCDENSIWFSLANKTLLSSLSSINYFNQDDFLEVFMTKNSFKKLQEIYPMNIIDTSSKQNYYYLNPFYVEGSSKIVIKINILIPAGKEKTEKFYSLRNKTRQWVGYWCSYTKKGKNITKCWYKFLALFYSNLTWYELFANIYDKKFNGYFIVDNFNLNINQNWIPSLTFEIEKIEFLDLNCPIIKETKVFLDKRYGLNWLKEPIFKKNKKSLEFNWTTSYIN